MFSVDLSYYHDNFKLVVLIICNIINVNYIFVIRKFDLDMNFADCNNTSVEIQEQVLNRYSSEIDNLSFKGRYI